MITEHDLQEAIAECEGQRNPTASTCIKLAAFYALKDKMYPNNEDRRENTFMNSYSRSSGIEDKTDFMQVASRMDHDELMIVMDELMTTVKVLLPKLYDGVMRKLNKGS